MTEQMPWCDSSLGFRKRESHFCLIFPGYNIGILQLGKNSANWIVKAYKPPLNGLQQCHRRTDFSQRAISENSVSFGWLRIFANRRISKNFTIELVACEALISYIGN